MPANISMIEKVARNLHHLTIKNGGTARAVVEMREDAAAIIAAMRDPSEEMLEAAAKIDLSDLPNVGGATYWRAMIDAALEELRRFR